MNDSEPHIVSITAGGAGMFCGSCMRDNTLAATLLKRGVPMTLVPAFTPIRTEESDVSSDRVVLGGVNVYLEQKWPWLGRLPRPVRRALDHPRLLGALSGAALQTRRDGDGEVALSLLRGASGRQAAEVRELVGFLLELAPDLVSVTNLLIAGFVPSMKERLNVPVAVTLQGDDLFLDALPTRDRGPVLQEMRRVAKHVDLFQTFTEDYAARMAELFEIPLERLRVIPLGLGAPHELRSESASEIDRSHRPPTIGYLARLCPEKGLHRLVDAFLRVRQMPGTEDARLRLAGWQGAVDRPFVEDQLRRLKEAAGEGSFDLVEVPDRAMKARFLSSLDVFSVPTVYREPKGLYVLEALAAGVPVVQPAHGSFPEILEQTGGGVLVKPGDHEELAVALHRLLCDPEMSRRLAAEGQRNLDAFHHADQMADATLQTWRELIARHPVPNSRDE